MKTSIVNHTAYQDGRPLPDYPCVVFSILNRGPQPVRIRRDDDPKQAYATIDPGYGLDLNAENLNEWHVSTEHGEARLEIIFDALPS